jgi:hypothetical protein
MDKLANIASLMRSKNAGPFMLTIDIMFDDMSVYDRVKDSGAVSRAVVAEKYGLSENKVMFFYCDKALAIKASIPRPITQGDIGDADGHGGQQFIPLMDIDIP